MSKEWILCGLGNPGKNYQRTRHNIGFMAIDRLPDRLSTGNPSWRDRFGAQVAELSVASQACLLIKPQTFMNLSGEPLRDAVRFYQVDVSRVVVLHDDLDLPFGRMRIKIGGGDGGHNGLKSITAQLGSKEYIRIKLGIGRPVFEGESAEIDKGRVVTSHVLGRFSSEEEGELRRLLDSAVDAVECIVKEGLLAAQGRYN